MTNTQKVVRDSYQSDDQFSWDIHDEYSKYFFQKISKDGIYIPCRNMEGKANGATLTLQKSGIDVITVSRVNGNPVHWDEKADRHSPINLVYELHTNTNVTPWIDGWGITSKADWLLYNFTYLAGAIDSFAINFPRLQRYLWKPCSNGSPMYEKYPPYRMPNTLNHSYSRLVLMLDVLHNVPAHHYIITRCGEVEQIPLFAPASDYLKDGNIIRPHDVKIFDVTDENITLLEPKVGKQIEA